MLLNAGYELWSVEQPLEAGVAELAALSGSNLTVGPNPVADVVLQRQDSDRYVLTECKPTSFGAGSEHAPQARGLIVAAANVASRLGLAPGSSAEVCYLVPAADAAAMDAGLIEIAEEVSAQGLGVTETGAVGLSVRPDGVFLGLPAQLNGNAQMPRALVPEQRVVAAEAGQDPRPLYVVPWIPDASDDQDLAALREKIRAQTLAWLGRLPLSVEQTLRFDDLLDEVSRGVYRTWRNRDSLRGRVFPAVQKILDALFGSDGRVQVRRRDLLATLGSHGDREELMEKVRTSALPERLPPGVQLRLGDEPTESN